MSGAFPKKVKLPAPGAAPAPAAKTAPPPAKAPAKTAPAAPPDRTADRASAASRASAARTVMHAELALISKDVSSMVLMEEAEPIVYVPTISPSFNRAIQIGGAPARCVWVITGPFGAGKTAVTVMLIRSLQEQGHLSVFVDAEHAADTHGWFEALGVDLEGAGYIRPENYEDTVKDLARIIHNFKKAKDEKRIPRDRCLAIVVDSINKLVPKDELADLMKTDLGRQYPIRAMLNSAWLDRMTPIVGQENIMFVLLAQESQNVDAAAFAPKTKMKGGQRLAFDATVLIRVNYAETINEEVSTKEDEEDEEVEASPETLKGKKAGKGKKKEKDETEKRYVGRVHNYTIVKNKVGVCNEVGFLCTSTGKGDWPKGFDFPRETMLEALHRGSLKPNSSAHYLHELWEGQTVKGKKGLLKFLRTGTATDGRPAWEALRDWLDADLRSGLVGVK